MLIISEIREDEEQKTVPISRYASDKKTPLTREEIRAMLRGDLSLGVSRQ